MTMTSEVFSLLSRLTKSAAPRSHDCSELAGLGHWSAKRINEAFGASFRSLES
jgi:hypothetical protein